METENKKTKTAVSTAPDLVVCSEAKQTKYAKELTLSYLVDVEGNDTVAMMVGVMFDKKLKPQISEVLTISGVEFRCTERNFKIVEGKCLVESTLIA